MRAKQVKQMKKVLKEMHPDLDENSFSKLIKQVKNEWNKLPQKEKKNGR